MFSLFVHSFKKNKTSSIKLIRKKKFALFDTHSWIFFCSIGISWAQNSLAIRDWILFFSVSGFESTQKIKQLWNNNKNLRIYTHTMHITWKYVCDDVFVSAWANPSLHHILYAIWNNNNSSARTHCPLVVNQSARRIAGVFFLSFSLALFFISECVTLLFHFVYIFLFPTRSTLSNDEFIDSIRVGQMKFFFVHLINCTQMGQMCISFVWIFFRTFHLLRSIQYSYAPFQQPVGNDKNYSECLQII